MFILLHGFMNYTLFNFMNTSHELYLMIILIFFMRLMLDTCSSGDGSSFLASWRGSWDDPHKSRAARTRAQATMLGVWVGSGDLWRAGTSGATEDELWSLPLAFVSTELCFQSPGSSFFCFNRVVFSVSWQQFFFGELPPSQA